MRGLHMSLILKDRYQHTSSPFLRHPLTFQNPPLLSYLNIFMLLLECGCITLAFTENSHQAMQETGGFKLFYYGVDGKRNGVGVILKEEYSKSLVKVKRVSDRVLIVKVEVEGKMINVISAYAPQVGCEMVEKERFWSELDEVVDGVPRNEQLVIGADLNGHVGEGNRGDEEVMGRYGLKEWNVEGQMVVDFAKRMEMAVVNTYFKKKEDHRVTYKSGGRFTQVDYVLCRRCNLKKIGDCKVLAGDSVARQHQKVVCRMVLEAKKKRRIVRTERRMRWWKVKEEECSVRFREEVRQRLGGGEEVLEDCGTTAGVMREAARKLTWKNKAKLRPKDTSSGKQTASECTMEPPA
ncbi:hypothetical protein C0J50_9063 [Silurus asotus]|uniref:Craniofacial development protein 2-like n=1 Tax=Silurus asotus TaxID=30991 RepID=A0AAD5ADY1_SILAS|nr:hypothetical protein C0J50_9063 [Silurus asotus]